MHDSGMMTGHAWDSSTGKSCTPAETAYLESEINDDDDDDRLNVQSKSSTWPEWESPSKWFRVHTPCRYHALLQIDWANR